MMTDLARALASLYISTIRACALAQAAAYRPQARSPTGWQKFDAEKKFYAEKILTRRMQDFDAERGEILTRMKILTRRQKFYAEKILTRSDRNFTRRTDAGDEEFDAENIKKPWENRKSRGIRI